MKLTAKSTHFILKNTGRTICRKSLIFIGLLSLSATPVIGSDRVNSDVIEGIPTSAELLLTEIIVTPTAGEFIEIHNPGGSAVDLSNVYLTDATFAGGSIYYYNIVLGADAGGGSFGDFHARFPDGASIPAGAYQTVSLNGSDNFFATYGVDPSYELYEDGDSADAIPDMREALPGSINGQGGLSNGGEVVILYSWNGASDLVQDLDYGLWGDAAEAVDKTGVAIDGPDGDSDTSTYLADTAIPSQDVILDGGHASGNSFSRQDLTEGTETQSGGNGIDGDDETSENLSVTWREAVVSPNEETPPLPETPPFGNCGDEATFIFDVQGSGLSSPIEGEEGVIIEGVVVGDFQESDQLRGYFLQEEDSDADGDPQTSDGVFVLDNGFGPDVTMGGVVRVQGTVEEFFGFTQLADIIDMADCGVTDTASAAAINLPQSTVDDWEPTEGMAITFPQTLYASGNFTQARFGEVDLAVGGPLDNPTNVVAPGAPANALQALNNVSRIQLDDGSRVQNPLPLPPYLGLDNTLRTGDSVDGLTGALGYSFGSYEVHPTSPVDFVRENDRPLDSPNVGSSLLKVASFNVLNYFTTLDNSGPICGPNADQGCRGADTPEEFARQKAKLVSAITTLAADVAGLMELENAADDTPIADLVDGLNAVAGPGTYAYLSTGAIGDDAIRQGLIYKPATVTAVGGFAVLDNSVDPDFHDQLNRPVLAQTFEENASGERFTVAVNHLKSKGSNCNDEGDPDTGDGQGNCNQTRTAAAMALVDWLATDPTGSGDPDFLIMGDLNAYAMEDPVMVIESGGYVDLVKTMVGTGFADGAYSFNFFSQSGYLDHALSSPGLASDVSGAALWHINADEPSGLDYNNFNQPGLYNPDQFRSSDHDAVVVGLFPDGDGDGVWDEIDMCPDTVIPEGVPMKRLGTNRFALANADQVFDTKSPRGRGPRVTFDIFDTTGCSCEQISEELGLGNGHTKFGCSIGIMKEWVDSVN